MIGMKKTIVNYEAGNVSHFLAYCMSLRFSSLRLPCCAVALLSLFWLMLLCPELIAPLQRAHSREAPTEDDLATDWSCLQELWREDGRLDWGGRRAAGETFPFVSPFRKPGGACTDWETTDGCFSLAMPENFACTFCCVGEKNFGIDAVFT